MLAILLFIPADVAGACFLGFAIGESLGAAALRIAGGIFTKIADIGSDLMKVVFKIKEDDARNPGVIADCTGDNAGDSVGPTADGFETYGVTGVALISFIVLAVTDTTVQAQLLVWIFLMRVMMVLASGFSYLISNAMSQARYGNATRFNFEAPLTQLVWLTSIVSVVLTYIVSYLIVPDLGGNGDLWWQLSTRDHLRHAGRRDHPGDGEGLHQHRVAARARGGDLVARGRRVAQHPVRPRGRQLLRLLARHRDHAADGDRLRGEHPGPGRAHEGPGDLRLRPGGVRLPRHGAGHHRGGQLRPGHRQRPVGLRALADRADPRRRAGDQARLRLRRRTSSWRRSCWRRTTGRGTPSRPRPSRC